MHREPPPRACKFRMSVADIEQVRSWLKQHIDEDNWECKQQQFVDDDGRGIHPEYVVTLRNQQHAMLFRLAWPGAQSQQLHPPI